MVKILRAGRPGLGWIPAPDVRDDDYPMRHLLPRSEQARQARPDSHEWAYPWPALNQGNTGTCEGHSGKNFLLCQPVVQTTPEAYPTAFDIYDLSTVLDGIDGNTGDRNAGTTTNGMMKALRQLGFVNEWRWAKSMDDLLDWLAFKGPVCLGSNWYDSMFSPDADGFVYPAGSVIGGHAYLARGYGMKDGKVYVRCVNSWGSGWGLKGEFNVWASDLEKLLFAERGDAAAAVEVEKAPPSPEPQPEPTPPAPPAPSKPDPQGPYQHTEFKGYDAANNEWVWEFRIQRGTGGWND